MKILIFIPPLELLFVVNLSFYVKKTNVPPNEGNLLHYMSHMSTCLRKQNNGGNMFHI